VTKVVVRDPRKNALLKVGKWEEHGGPQPQWRRRPKFSQSRE
jgi:hypothetical protein